MPECWKVISDYPNYWISTWGRVKNIRYNRMLTPKAATNGYLQVNLSNNHKSTSKCVHQLMALTFLGQKPFKFEISHKDDDKENNHLSNLEYVYYKENRKKRTIYRFCVICGELLSTRRRKTCSNKCFRLAHNVKLICIVCGKTFWRYKSSHERAVKDYPSKGENVYCSRQCRGIWFGKKYGWQTKFQQDLGISAWPQK